MHFVDGSVLLDEMVKPDQPVIDYLTKYSGITPADLKTARGQAAPGRTPEELHTESLSEGVLPESGNMEWCPMQKSGGAQPQTRVRLQNEGPGGLRRKNFRNCRERKSRTTFRITSNEGSKDPEEDGQDEGREVTGN